MRLLAALFAALLLAACHQPERERPAPQERPTAAETSPAAPALPGAPVQGASAIVGEWRVAGTGDQALSQAYGMSASIGRDTIRVVSQCVFMTWSYRLASGRLKTSPIPSTIPPCLRPRSIDEMAVQNALDAATDARRLDNGALVLSGPGGSVTLFTQ